MVSKFIVVMMAAWLLLLGCQSRPPIHTVPQVDLERFMAGAFGDAESHRQPVRREGHVDEQVPLIAGSRARPIRPGRPGAATPLRP